MRKRNWQFASHMISALYINCQSSLTIRQRKNISQGVIELMIRMDSDTQVIK